MGILGFCGHVAFVVPLMLESAVHICFVGGTKTFLLCEQWIHIYLEFNQNSLLKIGVTTKYVRKIDSFRFTADNVVFQREMTSIYICNVSATLNHLALELIYLAVFMYNKVKGFHIVTCFVVSFSSEGKTFISWNILGGKVKESWRKNVSPFPQKH